MKARFMIENPDEVEATLKITMTVKEWTELRDQLSELSTTYLLACRASLRGFLAVFS